MALKEMTPEEMNATNTLAFLLEKELRKTAERFFKFRNNMRDKLPECSIGAANIFMSGILVNTTCKEDAMTIFEKNCEVVRNILESTPDYMYRGYPDSKSTKN